MKLQDWAVSWFQWYFSIPKSLSPDVSVDTTGERAGLGQHGPVWFLPPHIGVGTTTISIPEGKAILVSPGAATTVAPAGAETEDQLRADAEANADFLNHIKPTASLDGVPVPEIRQFRVQTPLCSMMLPEDNDFDKPISGRVAAIGEGNYLLFPPLPLGKHVLHLQSGPNEPIKVDRTFILLVEAPNEPSQ